MSWFLIASVGVISYFFFLLLFEHIAKKFHLQPDFSRRLSHVTGSLFAIFFAFHLPYWVFLSLVFLFFLLITFSHKSRLFTHIHGVSRKTYGEEFLPFGFIASYVIAQGNSSFWLPAFLLVGLVDPIAGYTYQNTQNHRITFFIFSFLASILLVIVTQTSIPMAVIFAVCIAATERVSSLGSDNFTIPVVTSLLLVFLG